MIYTVSELKALIPSLIEKTDDQISALIEQAEGEILFLLKKTTLPVDESGNHPSGVKTACRLLIEGYISDESRKGMESYKQGSIQVQYESSTTIEEKRSEQVRRSLAPFLSVKIWS